MSATVIVLCSVGFILLGTFSHLAIHLVSRQDEIIASQKEELEDLEKRLSYYREKVSLIEDLPVCIPAASWDRIWVDPTEVSLDRDITSVEITSVEIPHTSATLPHEELDHDSLQMEIDSIFNWAITLEEVSFSSEEEEMEFHPWEVPGDFQIEGF